MVKDSNGYAAFWRYFWMENEELFLYTGNQVLGEEEETILSQLRSITIDKVYVSVSLLDNELGEAQFHKAWVAEALLKPPSFTLE